MSYAVSPARTQLAHPAQLPRSANRVRRTSAFDADLVALLPSLKAYALSLCRNGTMADDLVQSASAGAMANAQQFQVGSTMRAWLFTILRNQYFSILRKRRHEIEDADGKSADKLSLEPTQNDSVDLADAMRAVRALTPKARRIAHSLGPRRTFL